MSLIPVFKYDAVSTHSCGWHRGAQGSPQQGAHQNVVGTAWHQACQRFHTVRALLHRHTCSSVPHGCKATSTPMVQHAEPRDSSACASGTGSACCQATRSPHPQTIPCTGHFNAGACQALKAPRYKTDPHTTQALPSAPARHKLAPVLVPASPVCHMHSCV